jgi:hypothetical protein
MVPVRSTSAYRLSCCDISAPLCNAAYKSLNVKFCSYSPTNLKWKSNEYFVSKALSLSNVNSNNDKVHQTPKIVPILLKRAQKCIWVWVKNLWFDEPPNVSSNLLSGFNRV